MHAHNRIRGTSAHTSCLVAICAAALAGNLAQAGIVDPMVSPTASGPGLVSMSYNDTFNVSTGNDNVVGSSPNRLEINQKAFGPTGFVDAIDIVFTVIDTGTGDVTEYEHREGVDNGTGSDWTDYHVTLGFGTGASFVQSSPGDGLDFDAPDEDSLYDFGPFTSLTIGEDTIDAVGGVVPDGSFVNFRFPIDVPDGITEFTLRQLPTTDAIVPEPKAWILVGISLGMFGFLLRAQQRSHP